MAQDYASDRQGLDAGPEGSRASGGPPMTTTAALFEDGARKLLIAHAGEIYTLQLTRQNRLLLTK